MEMKTILSGLNIGLWIIRFDPKTNKGELYADEIMRDLLGVDKDTSPDECYSYWQKNIVSEYAQNIDNALDNMINSDKVVQVEYRWNHPQKGEMLVRASGRCTDKNEDVIVIEGFHRIISE